MPHHAALRGANNRRAIMSVSLAHSDMARRPLRGICLVVTGKDQKPARHDHHELPGRPDSRVLSEAIPLFFIARNRHGLWVVREAEGRKGGIFLFKHSALRFAARMSAPAGCATMVLNGPLDLDVEHAGGAFAADLNRWLQAVARIAPKYLAPLIRR
jgi:hypothetical protein